MPEDQDILNSMVQELRRVRSSLAFSVSCPAVWIFIGDHIAGEGNQRGSGHALSVAASAGETRLA